MDRETWRAVVHGGRKESDTTERLNWTELNEQAGPLTEQRIEQIPKDS